jgi:hypothetical protein
MHLVLGSSLLFDARLVKNIAAAAISIGFSLIEITIVWQIHEQRQ